LQPETAKTLVGAINDTILKQSFLKSLPNTKQS
jgi:hypothetical protein